MSVEPGFIVVGDLMTDVVAQASGPLRYGSDIDAVVTTHGGGGGGNTASWLAAEGHPTAYVGRVGADRMGRMAIEQLEELGVQVLARIDPVRSTGTVVVVVDPGGERTMLPDAGANAGLSPSDLPDDAFRPGRHLHLSGYTLLHEGSRLAGLAALDLARLRDMTVSVDPASTGPILDTGVDRFLGWIEGCDVLLANETEACLLTGLDDPGDAGRELTMRFGGVVVKVGAEGAWWYDRDGAAVHSPAVALTVIDTTGAGDAFAAGFLPAWRNGASPADSLAAGNRVASMAVSRVGARP